MRTISLLPAVALSWLASIAGAAGDERQDWEQLQQALADFKRVAPAGWTVAGRLTDPANPRRRGSRPAIVIESDEPLPAEFHIRNPNGVAEGSQPAPKTSLETVRLSFVVAPFLSPEDQATARAATAALLQRRLRFEADLLKQVRYAHMGPEPIPPSAFAPRTEAETRLVTQYALLWVSTQPQPLPTHHADGLSFEMRSPGAITIHDAAKSAEYAKLLEDVRKTFVPYETER